MDKIMQIGAGPSRAKEISQTTMDQGYTYEIDYAGDGIKTYIFLGLYNGEYFFTRFDGGGYLIMCDKTTLVKPTGHAVLTVITTIDGRSPIGDVTINMNEVK